MILLGVAALAGAAELTRNIQPQLSNLDYGSWRLVVAEVVEKNPACRKIT